MFFSGRRLLDRFVKIRLSNPHVLRTRHFLKKTSQNAVKSKTCCSVFSLVNHTLSIYSKISCNTPMLFYPLSNQQLQHALGVYQNAESRETCLEFVCSLDSSIISIWISTLLASSETAYIPFIWLKRDKRATNVSNNLFFGNWFEKSITKAVRRPRCPGVGSFASPRPKHPAPTSWLCFSRDPELNGLYSSKTSLTINMTAVIVDDRKDMSCILPLKYYKPFHKQLMRTFGQSSWGLRRPSTSGLTEKQQRATQCCSLSPRNSRQVISLPRSA